MAEIFTEDQAYVEECVIKIPREILHNCLTYGLSKFGEGGVSFIWATLYTRHPRLYKPGLIYGKLVEVIFWASICV